MSLDQNLKQADAALQRLTRQAELGIGLAWADALDEIRKLLATVYAEYAVDGRLTFAEMAKYNRLLRLKRHLLDVLHDTTADTSRRLNKSGREEYEESYYRTGYALESETQSKLAYAVLAAEVIARAVQAPVLGFTLADRMKLFLVNADSRVLQDVVLGLNRGETYRQMAARVKAILDTEAWKAMRIAQTEAHRLQNAGRLLSMQHAANRGVEMQKMWLATLDERTRTNHQTMDGQKRALDDDFESPSGAKGAGPGMMGDPEDDINCRCVAVPLLFEPTVRRSREGVIPYTTYEEWKANRLSAD